MVLDGRVAIVTGAGSPRGIGRAAALALARTGADVVVCDVNLPGAEEIAAEIRALGRRSLAFRVDVTDAGEIARMVEGTLAAFGRIDVLFNIAGITQPIKVLDMTEADFDRIVAVNLKGTFLCSQAVAKVMVERGIPGRIIAISSISAIGGGGQQAHYCPTKAGQDLLMKSMAIQLGPHGITCNCVAPGTIETDINREDLANPTKREYMLGRIPLRRLGKPEDIAGPVVFLASDDAAYVTGAFLLVDGGFLGNLQ